MSAVCPWSSRIGYDCELPAGHDGDHVATDLDGKSKVGWADDHRTAYRRDLEQRSAEAPTQKRAGRFECGVCGKRIWRGWFAPGIAGGPPNPVKCGACSNPPRDEEIPAEHADNAREVEEIRELVSGMFEERTNNATAMKDLIDDVVEHIYQERQRRERATDPEVAALRNVAEAARVAMGRLIVDESPSALRHNEPLFDAVNDALEAWWKIRPKGVSTIRGVGSSERTVSIDPTSPRRPDEGRESAGRPTKGRENGGPGNPCDAGSSPAPRLESSTAASPSSCDAQPEGAKGKP